MFSIKFSCKFNMYNWHNKLSSDSDRNNRVSTVDKGWLIISKEERQTLEIFTLV